MTRDPVTPELAEIAAAHGVATSFLDGTRTEVPIDAAVVRDVLGLLEVDVSGPGAERVALAHARERTSAAALPPTIGLRSDRSRPIPGGGLLTAVDGEAAGRARDVHDELPAGLDPARYLLETDAGRSTVVVAPPRLPDPPRTWGWMLQLYALHSRRSWGIGDLGDLTDLVRDGHGAGAVLVNPLHAITPVPPVQPSPYAPSSRRYATPLALRLTDLPAYADADPATRAEVDALRPETTGDRIAHDRVWAAKRSALEALWRSAGHPDGAPDDDLRDFATFCALAERYGGRWSRWPAELRHPADPGVAAARAELAPRVAFHAWVQRQVQSQLAAVRSATRDAGMAVGVIHDLAVGCDPDGADAWMLQDVLALDATVGAPPDAFNQRGQAWGLPPWRPDRLADTGYAAFGDMTRSLLTHADGLRIDHVMGLWRLWWVPSGQSPDRGTYVHYDADAMLAVLLLEAHRAGALVVGEDLGTVLPRIREEMAERNLLGSTVLWFARDPDPVTGGDDGPLRPPRRWPEQSVATVSTHDLPTAPGFLSGEQVRVRAELGLLDDPDREAAKAGAERDELLALLAAEGLLSSPDVTDEDEIVVALHRLLATAPTRLVLASFYDVLGETRQPNLPGTVDEYPNWRIPLPVSLEEALADDRVRRVAEVLSRR